MLWAAATKVNVLVYTTPKASFVTSRLQIQNRTARSAIFLAPGIIWLGMNNAPHTLGIISDTHGLLRPEAKEGLRGSDLIIHAGDVGNLEIVEELKSIAPLFVVRGNVDHGKWAAQLPAREVIQFAGSSIYVLHISMNSISIRNPPASTRSSPGTRTAATSIAKEKFCS